MTEKLINNLYSIQDLLNFYNKYLGLRNDEMEILTLVSELANSFKKKLTQDETIKDLSNKDLRLNENDTSRLSAFMKNCLKYYSSAIINIDEDLSFRIDEFGRIVQVIHANKENEEQDKFFLNKSIQSYLINLKNDRANKDLKNVIAQNILVSKIYKAVYEKLMLENKVYAGLFLANHTDMIFYEQTVNKLLNIKDCLDISGIRRLRSLK